MGSLAMGAGGWGTRLLVNATIDDNRQGLESHSSVAAWAKPARDARLSQRDVQGIQGQIARATYLKSK
jgi:hypothetical protein